jgi:hypothetical protein
MYETKGEAFFMVDKTTNQGTFFRIGNDYLDNEPIKYMPFHCSNGYYTQNIEPTVLIERIEKALANTTIDADKRKKLEDLLASIDEDDNNYIFIGKLKKEFGDTSEK